MEPSAVAREVDRAFWIIGGINLALFVGVTAVLVAFLFRYRRNRTKTTSAAGGNLPLEITWTVLPILLVLFMFWVGYRGFRLIRTVPPGARVVAVTGQQWLWTFTYPDLQITSDKLVIPIGEPVKLELTSRDVIHSLYIPAFRIKEDAVPGRTNTMWIKPERAGSYNVFCAEFCGKEHSRMYTRLDVLTIPEYEKWIEQEREERYKPVGIAEAADPGSDEIKRRDGKRLFETYCASCHGRDGQGGLVEGARNLTQVTGWKRSPRVTDIFRTLMEGIPGTQMRSFAHLPPWDLMALAHYVAHFSADTNPPVSTPEEFAKLAAEYDLAHPKAPARMLPIDKAIRIMADESGPQGIQAAGAPPPGPEPPTGGAPREAP